MKKTLSILLLFLLFATILGGVVYLIVVFVSKSFRDCLGIYFDQHWELIYWTAALVFSTIFLGIVAALQDFIRNWLWSPRLKCELKVESPHCHLFDNTTYYFRFMIHNIGNVSAKDVNVVINNIRDSDNNLIGQSSDNLKWSSEKIKHFETKPAIPVPRIYWKLISPGTYQYCNLGSITSPGIELKEGFKNFFKFSVSWPTRDRLYVIKAGIYTFELVIGCENAAAIKMFYKIQIGDTWYNNEKDMFEKSFRMMEERIIK